MNQFEIIKETSDYIAIDKPSGWMVHNSKIAGEERFVLQALRDQVNCFLYPVHRLDRGTSGVLVFAKTKECAATLGLGFRENLHQKSYLAICRGYKEAPWSCDQPLAKEKGKEKRNAITHFNCLEKLVLDIPFGKFEEMWFSLLEAKPKTGLYHQIRRHLNRSNLPIVGDRMHGDNRYNHWAKEHLGNERLLLHCNQLTLDLGNQKKVELNAPPPKDFLKVLNELRNHSASK